MSPVTKIIGLTTACAACCALPSAGTLLATAGVAGVSSATLGWGLGLAMGAVVLGLAFVLRRRAAAARACSTALSSLCGCSGSAAARQTEAA